MNPKLDILDQEAAIEGLVEEWDELARMVSGQPFSLPTLVRCWHHHLGRGRLEVATARNGSGRLEAVLAMDRRRKGPVSVAEPVGQDLGAISELTIRPGSESVAQPMWSAILDGESRPSFFATDLLLEGMGGPVLRRDGEWHLHALLSDECPELRLGAFESADAYLDVPARSGLRKKLRKAGRMLADHDFRTTFVSGTSAIMAALDDVLPLYDRAEANNPRLHLDRGHFRPFYRDALRQLGSIDQAIVAVADLDGEPIAFDVYVLIGRRAAAILGRFDPAHASLSPGQLLTRAAVDHFAANGFEVIDLQLGADLYKLRWATDSRPTIRVSAGSPSKVLATRATVGAGEALRAIRGVVPWPQHHSPQAPELSTPPLSSS